MSIRVLHVVTYMGRGGLETMIMNYYRHIDRNKVQFDFLVHRDFEADYDAEIKQLGGRIYHLPALNPFSNRYLKSLDIFFAEHKNEYAIVHSHLDCMAGIPLCYAKKYGVPVRIAHAHNSNQTKDKKYLLKLLYKQNIPLYANQFFACGKEAGKWMFGTNKFHVLNNAIETAGYVANHDICRDVRKELGIPEKAFVVGHVGRFAPPKNHEFIIEIFADILKSKQDSFLLLVGEGELKKKMEILVGNLGIRDKVIFTGLRSDVNRMLQAMDVFLFPSLYEGLPVSIIEAQAAGLPCLISDKVPVECKKTDLVKQIALEESLDVWKAAVIDAGKIIKRDTSKEIASEGFDIHRNAKWLECYYLKKFEQAYEKDKVIYND